MRRVVAVACFALAGLSGLSYVRDRAQRRAGEEFARSFTLAGRRADWVDSSRLEPAADLAALVLANAALEDALGTIRWSEMSPAQRQRWVAALTRLSEELEAARGLMLDAVAERPGWPFHRLLLGQLVYALDRRALSPDLYARPERWRTPLLAAAAAGPGVDTTFSFLGGALLESWGYLEPDVQAATPAVLARAFLDAGFVERAFRASSDVLGRARAIDLLPDSTGPLRAARDVLARIGDLPSVARLELRLEHAEIASRQADLLKLEAFAHLSDEEGLREGCRGWVSNHSLLDLDTKEGRRQAARVLELWPSDAGGWRGDPRADLVRFFLEGRQPEAPGVALERAVTALSGVPEVTRARAALLAGDRYAVGRALHDAQALGTFEWTPFLVELARAELAAGRPAAAAEAVGRIAPAAREECAVLLVRRQVARALGGTRELESAEASLARARAGLLGRREVGGTSLSLCVDPEQDAGRRLAVTVRAPGRALVAYGWNEGRVGSELVEGEKALTVPLAGQTGRVSFQIRSLAGAPAEIATAVVER